MSFFSTRRRNFAASFFNISLVWLFTNGNSKLECELLENWRLASTASNGNSEITWLRILPPLLNRMRNCKIWHHFLGLMNHFKNEDMIFYMFYSPSQSAPTILENWAPCFLKIGHPAFWKKQSAKNQGHCTSTKEEAAWSLLFLNKEWPCFFQPPFCKKQGARFLRIVGADWLGDCVNMNYFLRPFYGKNDDF